MPFAKTLQRLMFAGLLGSLVFAPRTVRADEPVVAEVDANPSTYPPPAVQTNLLLVGAAVTAGWYGAALATSFAWRDADSAAALRFPVAGPYMALAKTGCSTRESSCDVGVVITRTVITSLSAIGQVGGLLGLLEGVFLPTSAAPASAHGQDAAGADPGVEHVAVVPTSFGPGGLGIGIAGDF